MTRAFLDQLAPLSPALQRVWDAGQAHFPGLQIHAYEARLVQLLLQLTGAKRVIELGCFVGLSALSMAEAIGENAEIHTCERNPEHAALAKQHFAQHPLGKNITLHEGDAFAMIEQAEGLFDVAFIDAEKRKYKLYVEALLPKLKNGALLLIDNSLLKGAVESGEPQERVSREAIDNMQSLHAMLQDRSRFEAVTLPTSDGLTVVMKR